MNNISTSNNWDTSLYEDKHAFVWKYGEDLLQLLNPQPGESILEAVVLDNSQKKLPKVGLK